MKKLNLFLFGLFMLPGLCSYASANETAGELAMGSEDFSLDLSMDQSTDMVAEFADELLKEDLHRQWECNNSKIKRVLGLFDLFLDRDSKVVAGFQEALLSADQRARWEQNIIQLERTNEYMMNHPNRVYSPNGELITLPFVQSDPREDELIRIMSFIKKELTGVRPRNFLGQQYYPTTNLESYRNLSVYTQKELDAVEQIKGIMREIGAMVPPLLLTAEQQEVLQVTDNETKMSSYLCALRERVIRIVQITEETLQFFASR